MCGMFLDKSFALIHGVIKFFKRKRRQRKVPGTEVPGLFLQPGSAVPGTSEMKRKAVITGIGIVSPIGTGKENFSRALREGRDGAGAITRFSTERFPVKRVCEVKDFPLTGDADPFIQYGREAARQAFADSGVQREALDAERFGIMVSSSKGGMSALAGGDFAHFSPDHLNTELAREYQARGPMKCLVAACATGTVSVMEAAKTIEQDDADYLLTGASDASITPFLLAGYHKLGAYAAEEIRPFDRKRDGFLVGEGAGVLFVEEETHARARGARVYASLEAWAEATDPYRATVFDQGQEALARVLQKLMRKAGAVPRDIDYLNTHGTATLEGDRYESLQYKKAFAADAYHISYSSTKSMLGHMLGASGAAEIIACALALSEDFIPPTIHYRDADPECDLDYTPNHSARKKVNTAVSVSMGFGGHVSALLLRK